ncbi:hypothetical protein E2C01_006695 [Portunus trituberculatus]|uniref:Uncharacterized protein n=1 Tax=Portunus trituberculatus TaxID=210409 RepID=A0A5B7CYU5_PORTR|nr:hypothetical protein [Portunus trituberculatus]
MLILVERSGSELAEDPELRERVEGGVAWSGEWPDPGQASSRCVHVGDNLSVEQREAVEDKVESATQGPVRRALGFVIQTTSTLTQHVCTNPTQTNVEHTHPG